MMIKTAGRRFKSIIKILPLFAAFCVVCAGLCGCKSAASKEEQMLAWTQSRLDNYYDMERNLKDSRMEDDVYIFTFVTDDERQIEFEARCWYGAYSTPWGNISFLKQKYFSDDFFERLTDELCDGLAVDFTGYSTDEMIQWFKDISQGVLDVYAEYSDLYAVPEFTASVTYEDRTADITYRGQTDSYMFQLLEEELKR